MQNAECKMQNYRALRAAIVMVLQNSSDAKPYIPVRRRRIGMGQGTRPRSVGDAGSVSWRSGQRNRASEQREDFFGYHKRT